jgi:hypothetical protein
MTITVKNIRNRARRNYIYYLIATDRIPHYKNANGELQFKTEDLREYKKTHRVGRPPKERGNE